MIAMIAAKDAYSTAPTPVCPIASAESNCVIAAPPVGTAAFPLYGFRLPLARVS
jgi:hypothetical protein